MIFEIDDEKLKKILTIGITALKESDQNVNKWQKTFNEMFDGHFVPTYDSKTSGAIIKMIELLFDEPQDSILSWWIYEMDYGERVTENSFVDENGVPIPIKTIDDIFNFYKKSIECKKNEPTPNKPVEDSVDDCTNHKTFKTIDDLFDFCKTSDKK
jgi:hypothetical protein